MIDPPSVPESATACMAMVESTWSTSRLELTASPISRSASSCSTFFASSALRDSSSCTSLTPLTAIAACPANAVTIAISRSSNGLDLVSPEVERTDDLVVDEHRRAHDCPVPGDLLEVVSAVLRIGQHVRDLLGPPVQPDTADQCVAVDRHRVLGDDGDRLVGESGRLDQLVDAVLEEIEVGGVRPAELASALDDGREDALGIGGRATHGREYLVGGLELVPQRVEVPSELLVLLDTDAVSPGARCDPPAIACSPVARGTGRRGDALRVSRKTDPTAIVRAAPVPRPRGWVVDQPEVRSA